MKVYKGEPGKPVVFFEGTKAAKPFAPKIAKLGFAWGKPTIESCTVAVSKDGKTVEQIKAEATKVYKDSFQACTRLALAILLDVLGDEKEAQKYYMRFKQRMIEPLDPNSAWSFSSLEVVACLTEIKVDFEAMRVPMRMAAQEPTPIVSERSADVTWHKDR